MTPAVMMVMATVATTVGTIVQAQSASAAAEVDAENARSNAQMVNSQGTLKQERQRQRFKQVLANATTAMGEGGTTLTGSNLDVFEKSAVNAEFDNLLIRYNSDISAAGLVAQASNADYRASDAKTVGYLGAASAALGGANQYYQQQGAKKT